jgi:hypothetical protein
MAQADSTYDYTAADRPASDRTYSGATPFGGPEDGPVDDDYAAPDIDAPSQSADEIEAERGFNSIPAGGPYELQIMGFEKDVETGRRVFRKHRTVYFGSRHESYESYSVRVRLGAVAGQVVTVPITDPETNDPILDSAGKRTYKQIMLNPSYTIKDMFELPPKPTGDAQSDRVAIKCYLEGLASEGGRDSDKGLMASKFFHFVERLGFPFKKGQKLPPEALNLDNWIGRKVIAPVKAGKPFTKIKKEFNKETGERTETPVTYVNNQVDLFKYSVHPETIERYKRGGELAAAATHSSQRSPSRPPVSPEEQRAADEKDSEQATAARTQADAAARKKAATKKPVDDSVLSNI